MDRGKGLYEAKQQNTNKSKSHIFSVVTNQSWRVQWARLVSTARSHMGMKHLEGPLGTMLGAGFA